MSGVYVASRTSRAQMWIDYKPYSPCCGETMEGVDTERQKAILRCSKCGKGYEVWRYGKGGWLISSASIHDKPKSKG